MSHTVTFPEREIRVIRADVEIEIEVSNEVYDRLTDVFNQQHMNPLIRVTLKAPQGTASFDNLKIVGFENYDS